MISAPWLLRFCCLSLTISVLSAQLAIAQWVKVENRMAECFASDSLYFYVGGNFYILDDTIERQSILRSSDHGMTWFNASDGLTSDSSGRTLGVLSLVMKGAKLFAGTNIGIFVSSDHADNWTRLSFDSRNGFVQCLLVDDSLIFAGVDAGWNGCLNGLGGIFRSTDDGVTWTSVNSGLADYGPDKRVFAIANIGTTLNAGTMAGGAFYSTNHGANWIHSQGSNNLYFTSFAAIDSNLFAGLYPGAYQSTDYGKSWTRPITLTDTPGSNNYLYVSSFATAGSILFVGSSGNGVYLSADYGATWRAVNDGIDSLALDVFSLAAIDSFLFAGTGSGTFRRPLSEILTSVNTLPSDKPDGFSLFQNYPNPFNPTTIINFRLAAKSEVTLRVYDVLGREVKMLVHEVKGPGTYEVLFDGSHLATGIYFYRLQTRNGPLQKKMILLR